MEQKIKDCWRNARFSTGGDIPPHRHTALQRLIQRYKRFSRVALIMACSSPLYFYMLLRNNSIDSVWQIRLLTIFMMMYCFTASAMDGWIARGLSSINLAEMSVFEVCRRAFFYRKRHFQFMAVLIPMCMIILGWLVWLLSGNKYFLFGVISGAVIGVIAGFIALRRFLKEYKALTSDEK